MAEPEPITPELRELVEPHLKEHLDPDSWGYIDQMFAEVIYTQPGEVPLVTLNPVSDFPAMQFSCITGEFMELTNWEYIQTVDMEEQLRELEEKHRVEEITAVLKHYHKVEYQGMTDYEKIIYDRRELNVDETTLYEYSCPCQIIYLKEDNYPISYGNQKVDTDYYYYNFGDEEVDPTSDEIDLFTYKVPYEWKRETIWD